MCKKKDLSKKGKRPIYSTPGWRINARRKFDRRVLPTIKTNKILTNTELYSKGKEMIPIMSSNKFKSSDDRAILNLDNKGSGTHWVGIKEKNNNFKYFDSFGTPPPFHLRNKIIEFNPKQFQNEIETNCGKRAFNWLISKEN